jgi:hypothetical protein
LRERIRHALSIHRATSPGTVLWGHAPLIAAAAFFGAKMNSPFLEIARVLVCFDHVASFIVNADHSIV